MISFIKLFPVIRFFLLQLMLLKYYVFVAWLCWCWVSAFLTNLRGYVLGCFFLGVGKWCFLLRIFFLRCCAEYYLPGCFHIARHLAAESGTRCLLPVYMSSLLWVDDSQLELTLFSLVSATSSCVDDIAFTKNFMWAGPDVASTATRTSCPLFCSFLRWFWLFVAFDRDFLVVGTFFLRCKWVYFIYRWFFGLFCVVVNFWSEEMFAK